MPLPGHRTSTQNIVLSAFMPEAVSFKLITNDNDEAITAKQWYHSFTGLLQASRHDEAITAKDMYHSFTWR